MESRARVVEGPSRGLTTRVLSFHAGYACRSSGACCCSGWPIPVEPEIRAGLEHGIEAGRLELPVRSRGRPPFVSERLAFDALGRCSFFEGEPARLCAIQRGLGHAALPSACRHFPRVALVGRDAVSITLSHYCPTAAALLFEAAGSIGILEDARGFPPQREYEGLDVRDALAPLLRPGVLMSHESYERFERHAIATLAREDLLPEQALLLLSARVEAVRRWTPAHGTFDEWLEQALETEAVADASAPSHEAAWADVMASVPPLARPSLPDRWQDTDARRVRPGWEAQAGAVRRFLAAKAFASWCAFQGDGLRTTLRAVTAALAVLRVECARGCAAAARPLDSALLRDAIRRTDLLLCHWAAPDALARRLSACERAPA